MSDENGYNHKLTTSFSDGESVVEYFKTERGVEMAKKWWTDANAADNQNGETYSLTGFDEKEL